MSGHSKFANIKHKKEKNDAKKGKIFTIIGREIVIAVKEGGPDPANNSKLRDVIAKAKANNMPNDTIDRCAAITSRMNKAKLPTHIEIEASAYGIVRDSVILLEQLRTIDKRRLKDKICHLTPEQLSLVNEALKISLDLPT